MEWIKDKTYYKRKYNTEKQEHEYSKQVMTETITRVIEENTLLKKEIEYLNQILQKRSERIKQKIERIRELENGKTHK